VQKGKADRYTIFKTDNWTDERLSSMAMPTREKLNQTFEVGG